MLSYTFINIHSQVSDPGPKDPLVSLIRKLQILELGKSTEKARSVVAQW